MLKNLAPVLLAVLFGSCTPVAVYTINPVGPVSAWNKGKEVLTSTSHGVSVSISLEKKTDDSLIYNVEILNQTGDKILIAPEQFYYEFFSSSYALSPKYFAYDPEKQILSEEKRINYLEREMSNNDTEDLVVGIFGLIDTFSSHGETRKEREERHNYYDRIERNSENEEQRLKESINEHKEKMKYLAANTIRKTTLASNQIISGIISFPSKKRAGNIKISLPIGDAEISFLYIITQQ